ncbi:uncharacterized protein LOC143186080 isoform X2 [Calliopsis andreniformis]|uniref:uncharacterized protein LOC143186080 isoform X2 n=1 Tax=Calliopsis andreniformis TaxID=337506 RepID=UPI003FCCCC30
MVRKEKFDTILECVPPLITAVGVMTKYSNCVFHVEKLKEVCNMIKSDNERLAKLPEFKVLQMHALSARKFSLIFTEDCYYIMLTHCYVATILIVVLLVPLDTMYITFTEHACAMFAVVGHRLKTMHILDEEALKIELGWDKCEKLLLDRNAHMYAKLVLCIKEHKRALECVQIIQSAFSVTLFFQVLMNIVCMSITGVRALFKLAEGNILDAMWLTEWTIMQEFHLFFLHLPGQRWHDSSMQVYYDTLECMWYLCFKKFRVVYQIMVMNSITPVKLTAFKMKTLDMESFLSVTQCAVSYFTVLSSTI